MNALTGTRALVRLALRRDRVTLSAWLVGLAGFTAGTTAMSIAALPTTADLVQATRLEATSPGMRLMGLASGASVGGYAMIRDYVTLAVLAALMSIFSVIRHTRQGEETGRAELLGAAVVGRQAGLAAALIVTVAANAVLAILVGLAMMLAGQPTAGSFTAGGAVAAAGIAFAGVAAVTSQLTASTRGASGLAAAVLGAAFLAAGIGNLAGHADSSGLRVDSAWPVWLSPIGWGQQMRPFGGDHWWPLTLAVTLAVACSVTAAGLAARRDLGHGMLPRRPGAAAAGRMLHGPWGLVWRLQRGALLSWATGMLVFGLVLGGVIGQMNDVTGSTRDWYVRVGGSDRIVDAYRASIIGMAGMAVMIYVVQILLRMRADESDGVLEPVLATAISRRRWVIGYATNVLIGAVALVLVFATAMGVAAGGVLGDPAGQVGTLVKAGLVQLPGILVIGSFVLATVGLVPRTAATVSWVAVLASVLLGPLFGPTLRLPGWLQDLSPFTHTPKAPAVAITVAPVLMLVITAGALTLVSLVSMHRRNLILPA
jgi:ABC-2 type transport system permease protein